MGGSPCLIIQPKCTQLLSPLLQASLLGHAAREHLAPCTALRWTWKTPLEKMQKLLPPSVLAFRGGHILESHQASPSGVEGVNSQAGSCHPSKQVADVPALPRSSLIFPDPGKLSQGLWGGLVWHWKSFPCAWGALGCPRRWVGSCPGVFVVAQRCWSPLLSRRVPAPPLQSSWHRNPP